MAKIQRFGDWQTRLDQFLESRREQSFAWGSNDCCMFAADAVLAITGTDIAARYRGQYHDAASAFALLGDRDPGDLMAEAAEELGVREVPRLFAQRGDVVLLDNGGSHALGIVGLSGDEVWSAGELAMERAPVSQILRAWRI